MSSPELPETEEFNIELLAIKVDVLDAITNTTSVTIEYTARRHPFSVWSFYFEKQAKYETGTIKIVIYYAQ